MKSYFFLFNAVTDAIRALQNLQQALIMAQQAAEDLFIESDD